MLLLIQMTVAQTHKVKLAGLNAIKNLCVSCGFKNFECYLVFLVPPAVFFADKAFQKQKIVTKDGKEAVTGVQYKQILWCMHKCQGKEVWD